MPHFLCVFAVNQSACAPGLCAEYYTECRAEIQLSPRLQTRVPSDPADIMQITNIKSGFLHLL